ncbi:pantetheine-phosphate adenylyltransferase [candidate division KSB1 bacterium 4484_188]|nr:MAG: pantetheine-phosphate adenylyltransferase [candidate division KSB1 bacterium 4484_188]HFE63730.1 pantetheine-phosphate adenylyltransferase [Caldithrix sp.]
MKRALYPGTFDPITNGHLDILERALKLFDHIIVTVAKNPAKVPVFTTRERIDLILEVVKQKGIDQRVSVEGFDGLVVDFARNINACVIIRGLRAVSDFEYELQMALMNRRLADEVYTVFMMPHEKYTYLNSTIVKEVARLGGDITDFVPECVKNALLKKLF